MMCAVLPRHRSLHSLHPLPLAPPVALLPLLHHSKFVDNLRIPPKESMASIDETHSHTGYEPNASDFKKTSVESYTELLTSPLFLFDKGFPEDAEYDDAALEGMLREAHRVHSHHSQREDLSVGLSSSSVSERTERPSECSSQDAQIRILLDRQKERILAECQAEINRHEFQAEELQRRDQKLLHGQLMQQNLELREAHQKSLSEMEEFKKFQSSTFDTIARRRLVDNQDTILELSGRIQELQNEMNCMSDFKGFSGCRTSSQWKFPRYQSTSVIPTSSDTWRNVATVFRNAEPPRRAAKNLGHTWYNGKRFCKSTCIFISS